MLCHATSKQVRICFMLTRIKAGYWYQFDWTLDCTRTSWPLEELPSKKRKLRKANGVEEHSKPVTELCIVGNTIGQRNPASSDEWNWVFTTTESFAGKYFPASSNKNAENKNLLLISLQHVLLSTCWHEQYEYCYLPCVHNAKHNAVNTYQLVHKWMFWIRINLRRLQPSNKSKIRMFLMSPYKKHVG